MTRPDVSANAASPRAASLWGMWMRLGLGVAVAFAGGVVAGYFSTQGSNAAPVSLMAVEQPAEAAIAAMPPARLEQALMQEPAPIVASAPVVAAPADPEPPVAVNNTVTTPKTRAASFNDRPLRKVKTIRMLVTGYSPDERSCGKWADGITASGYSVWTNGMKLVAADTRVLPFGTVISVPGYNQGKPVPVLDRGGKIKGNRLDLLFPTHEAALKWGKKWVEVQVYDYAD